MESDRFVKLICKHYPDAGISKERVDHHGVTLLKYTVVVKEGS